MNRTSRRLIPLAGVLGLSLLSCGREVTGPSDGLWFGRTATAALAIDPRFPELPSGDFASDLVPFVKVRVTVRSLDDKVLKDTTVDFPSIADSLALTLTLQLPSSAGATGVPLTLAIAFVNAAGDTVFRGGPSAIVAWPRGTAGAGQPIQLPVSWVPPGAVPASIVLTPTTGSVISGTTTVFRATAFDAAGDSIPNTPIVFAVDTASRATLVTAGSTSTATWSTNPGNVRVIASTLNLRADTSFFVVTLPVSTQLAITAAPTTAVAGTALSPITVAVRDASNALTPLFTVPVTLTLNAGATGATLAGTATVNAVGGVATFNGLSIQRAATGLTLTATSGALAAATSSTFTITPAAPAAIVTIAGDAQSGTLGQPLVDSVDVQLRDAFANPIAGSSIAFSVTSGGGSISPASAVTDASGRARARWTLGSSVGAQAARAQLAGVPAIFAALGATGAAGAPVRLEVITEPAATQVAGAAIAPAITVRAVDAVGATVTTFAGTVALALAANPGATTPTGVLSTAAVAGVASFTNVVIPAAAVGYTFAATSGALTPDTTVAFSVLNAAASQMTLVSGGGQTGTVGAALAAPFVVLITDAFGNGVPGVAVNWAVTTGAGSLASASGATNAAGLASNTLTLSNTAGGVTVAATASGLTGSPQLFAATALAGAVAQLAYTLNTSGGTAGAPLTPGWVIQARDAQGNLVPGFTAPVTVALSNGPAEATLGGTTTVNAVGGVATFADLSVDLVASSWVLVASSPGVTGASSAAFSITPAAPAAITVEAGDAQTGTVLTQLAGQITFRVVDGFGNPTNGTALTVAATSGGGSVGTSSGVTNVSGDLSTTWTLGAALGTQSVTATVTATPALQAVATATATPGGAVQLALVTAIGPQVSGVPVGDIVVEARDAAGNVATGFNGLVNGRVLTGPDGPDIDSITVTAVAGVATFTGQAFESAGDYTLRFNSVGLADAISGTITVTAGAAARIAAESATTLSGFAGLQTLSTVLVRVEDTFFNRVAGTNLRFALVRLADTLSATTLTSDANGLAGWQPVLPQTVGPATQVIVTSAGLLNSPLSFTMNVFPGPAATLRTVSQPTSTAAGMTLGAISVEGIDQFGNRNGVFNANVTVAVDSGPVGAVLSGTTTVAAVSGLATFGPLSLDLVGTYRLRFTTVAAGVADTVSVNFVIGAAAAANLSAVLGDGQTGTVGATLPTPLTARVADAFGNPVAGVAVAWTVTAGGGSLSVTGGVTSATGESSTILTLPTIAGGVTVQATSAGLTGSPVSFTATASAGTANQLAVATPAAGAMTGAAFTTQPVIEVRDASGNLVTTATNVVTMTVSAGGTVVGTPTATAVGGVATFATVGLSGAAGPYTLTFASGGLTSATQAITVTQGAATQLAVTTSAAGAVSGVAFTTQPVIAVRDAANTLVTTDNTSIVTMTVSAGGTVVGTATATAVGGVATFTTVGLSGPVGPYTLTFATSGLTSATQAITLAAGAATQLAVATGAAGAVSGLAFTTQPVITVRDAAGNLVTTDNTTSVTMSVSAGGTVVGAATATAVGGVATFTTAGVSGAVGSYALTFAAGGLASATQGIAITPAPATVLAWTGAVNNSWGTAGNWSLGRLPVSSDSVVIALTDTITISSASAVAHLTVGAVTSPRFEIVGGATLTVDSTAVFGATTQVVMTGGTLTGPGTVIITGPFAWSGGSMTGTGSTLIAPTSTATVTGAPSMNTRALAIAGTLTLGGTAFNGSNTVGQTPTMTVLAGGTLEFTSTTSYFLGNGVVDLLNAGTVRKSSSAGTVRVDWPITNTGAIEIQSGELDLRNSLIHVGGTVSVLANAALINGGDTDAIAAFAVAAGGRLQLQSGGISADAGNHIFGPGSSITGLGRLQINSADTTRIQGTLDIDSLTVLNGQTWFESADTMFVTRGEYTSGGFFRGTGVLAIRNSFRTVSGNLVGSGTIAVLPGATYTPQADVTGWRIDVGGTMIWGDQSFSLAQDPGTSQFASINVLTGGVVDIQHAATDRDIFGASALVTTSAGGTIRKSAGTAISTFRQAVIHAGVFDVQTGTLNMQTGSCTVTGGTKIGTGTLVGGCVIP